MKRILILLLCTFCMADVAFAITSLSELSNEKSYIVTCERGSLGVNDGYLVSTTRDEYEASAFAFIRYEDNYYMYSVLGKAFVNMNGTLSNETLNPITLQLLDDGRFHLLFDESYRINVSSGYTYGLTINSWSTLDPGNQFDIEEVEGDFNPTEALAVLGVNISPSCFVTYVVKDTKGNTLFTSNTVATIEGAHITSLPEEYRRPFTQYSETDVTVTEHQTTIEFTATWDGPFKLSDSFDSAEWYNMTIRSIYYVVMDETEPYCPKTDADLLTPESMWAFAGDAYNGIVVYNKAAGDGYTLSANGVYAVMREGVYTWEIGKNNDGFILKEMGSEYNCLNQYEGKDGPLRFWQNIESPTDDGSTFRVMKTVGQYGLNVGDVALDVGGTADVVLSLTNTNPSPDYTAYQFVVTLPEGVDWAKDEQDAYIYNLSERNSANHKVTIVPKAERTYSVVCYSPQSSVLTGSEGALMTFTVKASETIKNQKLMGHISEIVFSDTEGEDTSLNDVSFAIDVICPVIHITNAKRLYGDSNPMFGYTVTGGELRGEPVLICEATQASPVGTYPITAERGTIENTYYQVEDGLLTIEKDTITISVGDYTKRQGEAVPEFVLKYQGWKNGENESVLTKKPTVECEVTDVTGPGVYPIMVSGAEAQNYAFKYVVGTLTVTDAHAVVFIAQDVTVEYGDPIPALLYEVEAEEGVAVEGTPQLTCDAVQGSPAGEYTISISKGTVTNYNDTYVPGKLIITKAPLRVSLAQEYTRRQGEENPEFELVYEGWKMQDNEESLDAKPVATTEAIASSPVGEYLIKISGGESNKYEFEYVQGSLTVLDALRVDFIAVNDTVEYGEPIPTLRYRVETEDGAVVEGEPQLTCDAVQGSPAGEYTISISKGTVTNYNDTYVPGKLIITKAPLRVSVAQEYTRRQGEENPEFELAYEGWKMQDNEEVLDERPTAETEADADSPEGEYPIVVVGGSDNNYEFIYVEGKLTVLPSDMVNFTVIIEGSGEVLVNDGEPIHDKQTIVRVPKGKKTILEFVPGVSESNVQQMLGQLKVGGKDVTKSVTDNMYIVRDVYADTLVNVIFVDEVQTFDEAGVRYGVVDMAQKQVKIMRADYSGHVVVPEHVVYQGLEMAVTELSDEAFADNPYLISVSIPATVSKVGSDLFEGDVRLAAIDWNAPVRLTRQYLGAQTNGNMLIYVTSKDYAPENFQNIIVGSEAEYIVLGDYEGISNFYCPRNFTAKRVEYTHDYRMKTQKGVCQGWEALALPFDATSVVHKQNGELFPYSAITIADVEEGKKPFWLYSYTDDDKFVTAASIQANVPYIISMPNDDRYSEIYRQGGLVTFLGENVEVKPLTAGNETGTQRKFRISYSNEVNFQGYFTLNVNDATSRNIPEGSEFVKNLRETRPFEAFMVNVSAGARESFPVFEDMTDGIEDIEEIHNAQCTMHNGAYDLSGRKVVGNPHSSLFPLRSSLKKGIYIINGKKVVVR